MDVPRSAPDIIRPGFGRYGFLVTSVAALVAIAAAQLADLTTFLDMVALGGIDREANPVVVYLAETAGIDVLVVAKLALIGFAAMTFAILAPVSRRLAASVLTVATASGLVGATSNLMTLG